MGEGREASEAKIAGVAVELPTDDGSHRYRIDVLEVVRTWFAEGQLMIAGWHPGRGVQERRRR